MSRIGLTITFISFFFFSINLPLLGFFLSYNQKLRIRYKEILEEHRTQKFDMLHLIGQVLSMWFQKQDWFPIKLQLHMVANVQGFTVEPWSLLRIPCSLVLVILILFIVEKIRGNH